MEQREHQEMGGILRGQLSLCPCHRAWVLGFYSSKGVNTHENDRSKTVKRGRNSVDHDTFEGLEPEYHEKLIVHLVTAHHQSDKPSEDRALHLWVTCVTGDGQVVVCTFL